MCRNLALPLSQIFNSLAGRGWRLVSSSAAAAAAVTPSGEPSTQTLDRRYHIFIFISASDASAEELTPRGAQSPRGGSRINHTYSPPAAAANGGT